MNTVYRETSEVHNRMEDEGYIFSHDSFLNISFKDYDLSKVNFVSCYLEKADMTGCTFSSETFKYSFFVGCFDDSEPGQFPGGLSDSNKVVIYSI